MGKIILYCGKTQKKFTGNKDAFTSYINEKLEIHHSENLKFIELFFDFVQQLIDITEDWNSDISIYISTVVQPIHGWEGSRANYRLLVYRGSNLIFCQYINNMPYNCGVAVLQKFDYFANIESLYGKQKYELVIDKHIEFLNKIYSLTSYKAFVITLRTDLDITNALLKRDFTIGLQYQNKEGKPFYILNKTFTTKNEDYNYEKLKERICTPIEDEKPNSKTVKEPVTETSSESSSENRVNNSPWG